MCATLARNTLLNADVGEEGTSQGGGDEGFENNTITANKELAAHG